MVLLWGMGDNTNGILELNQVVAKGVTLLVDWPHTISYADRLCMRDSGLDALFINFSST